MSFPLIWFWRRCDFSFVPLYWGIAVISLWFCFKDWVCSRREATDRTTRGKKEGSMALRMADYQHRLIFCSNTSCRHGVPGNSFMTVSSNSSLIHLVTCYNNPQLFWNSLRGGYQCAEALQSSSVCEHWPILSFPAYFWKPPYFAWAFMGLFWVTSSALFSNSFRHLPNLYHFHFLSGPRPRFSVADKLVPLGAFQTSKLTCPNFRFLFSFPLQFKIYLPSLFPIAVDAWQLPIFCRVSFDDSFL